ncbi:MAG: DUF1993 domain-containing protein [Bdellovibrionales bacterium]|nr:DUF1993 domain-containing protein [Bdellovibrionales bacterium]
MLHDLTVPQFQKMLTNLQKILDKGAAYADAKKFDVNVLMHSRLAPDQFPLIKQIQIACDTAKLACARLTGKDGPVNEDKEQTFQEIRARIDSTLAYLKTLKPADFNGAEEKKISQPRWEGKWLTGSEYVLHHALPNIYFHITTAYSILRHNGVDVGKKDYLGEMPYKH